MPALTGSVLAESKRKSKSTREASVDISTAALAQPRDEQRGRALLEVQLVSGASTVTAAYATNPLKVLVPRARGRSVWAYTSSFGGGLVAGDETALDIRVGGGARCFIGTQASTKVYRNPLQRPCGHVTRAALEEDSLLVFAPDPVQAFAGSSYSQRQDFHVAAGAGLVLLDWFSSGRAARGERWAFNRLHSRNQVWSASPTSAGNIRSASLLNRVFLDSLLLDSADGPLDSQHRTGRFNCFALLLILGSPVREIAARLLESVSHQSISRRAPLVSSASPIDGGALLRVAGEAVEPVSDEIRSHLSPLHDLLGDDPWARRR